MVLPSWMEANHELGDLGLPQTGRPVIYANNGIISSGHYLTSMAGMRILLSGGNAFDALVAATFAAAVVEPVASYSLGAEATFMLYHQSSGDFLSLSGQGTAVEKATPEFFLSKGYKAIPTGPGRDAPMSFTVPGVTAACLSLLGKYGTKGVKEVLTPAIEYAEKGIPNYEYMITRLGAGAAISQFKLFPPGGQHIFFEDGQLPAPGSQLVQKNLAKILRYMYQAAEHAVGDRSIEIDAARKCFYQGEIASLIVSASNGVGGILEKSDLENYREKYSPPICTTFMGHEIHGHSTWTQGPVLQQALNILENFDLKMMGHNSVAYIHTITEALKLAFADREAFYGDPDFSLIPIDGLLSKDYGVERAHNIDPKAACKGLPLYGNPWNYSREHGEITQQPIIDAAAESDLQHEAGTTHIAAIDRDGNMVCSTPSGGAFEKSVFFSDLGFALSTRSEMLNFTHGHPNRLEPGKRPRTTIINYMISKDGIPVYTVGCPGGDAQPQANLQLMLNILLWNMNPQEAVEAPRFATLSMPNSFFPHRYLPSRLSVEKGIPSDVKRELSELGHEIVEVATCGMGATITKRDSATRVLAASADPRRACYAMGY